MNARHIRRGGTALVAALSALVLSLGLAAPAAAEVIENEGEFQMIEVNKTYTFTTEDPSAIGMWQDQDWWRFELPKSGTLQLVATSLATGDEEADAGWSISLVTSEAQDEFGSAYGGYNASINLLAEDGSKSTAITGVDAGTYDISVHPSRELDYGQQYQLMVKYTPSDAWESEYNNGANKSDALTLGKMMNGGIDNQFDQDWFEFTTTGFGTVEFAFDGTDATDGTWRVSVIDNPYAEKALYEKAFDSSSAHTTGEIEVSPGTHYVVVSGNQWDKGVVDSYYKLTATFIADAEIPMWRLYNPYSGEHLFTRDAEEREKLASRGWTDEGLAWTAPGTGEVVWRLYNPYSGDHHYTMKADEYESLAEIGWEQEGIAWYSASKDDKGAVPLYRLFNPYATVATHHYTASSDEYNKLGEVGWGQEGYAWYGVTPAKK